MRALLVASVLLVLASIPLSSAADPAQRARRVSLRSVPSWYLPAAVGLPRLPPPAPRMRAARVRPAFGIFGPSGSSFAIVDLGVPAGLSDPIPYAINDRGDVAIQYCPAATGCYSSSASLPAYLYDGRLQRLLPLARLHISPVEQYYPLALNDAGQIVGFVGLAGIDGARPVLWTRVGATGSKITLLDTANPTFAGSANGINAAGEIVGSITSPAGVMLAVRFAGGGYAPFPVGNGRGPSGGEALSVNASGVASGDIFGYAAIFTPAGAQYINLGMYGAPSSGIFIGNNGDVTGNYACVNGAGYSADPCGFLYRAASGPPSLGVQQILYGDTTFITGMNQHDDIVSNVAFLNCCSGDEQPGPNLDGQSVYDLLPAQQSTSLVPQTVTAINDRLQLVGQAEIGGIATAYEMFPLPNACGAPAGPPSCGAR